MKQKQNNRLHRWVYAALMAVPSGAVAHPGHGVGTDGLTVFHWMVDHGLVLGVVAGAVVLWSVRKQLFGGGKQ